MINLSLKEVNDEEKKVLSKGLNFAVTPQQLPVDEIITTEQACLQLTDTTKAASLRSNVTRILKKNKNIKQNISREERVALEGLTKNKDIMILPADKGRVTVVINTKDYDDKMQKMLTDSNTYVKLNSDPTNKFKNKLSGLLKNLKDNDKISFNTWQRLYPTAAETPKFYGLLKYTRKTIP